METFLQQIINGLTLGSVYALVALGYTMVYGIIGLINFAHGEVVMIGAMVALSVITALLGAHLPIPSVLIILAGLFVADRSSAWRSPSAWKRSRTGRCARRRGWRR